MGLGASHGPSSSTSSEGSGSLDTTCSTLVGKALHSMELLLGGSNAQHEYLKPMVEFAVRAMLPADAIVSSTIAGILPTPLPVR